MANPSPNTPTLTPSPSPNPTPNPNPNPNQVFDWDRFSADDSLGSVTISLEEELRPDRILEDGAGWPIEEDLSLQGSIRLRIAWRPENEVLVTSVDSRGATHGPPRPPNPYP